MRHLAKHVDIDQPEEVKLFISRTDVTSSRKNRVVHAYSAYAKSRSLSFSKPFYRVDETLPFVPLEAEIEALINATRNIRHSTLLRLLKETGARIGEVARLRFKDFDFEKKTVRISPEKGSHSRELKLSEKLVSMLMKTYALHPNRPLPTARAAQRHLERLRKIIAKSQNNPRLLNIHAHTFRHWKATATYHSTKDILFVKQILGHRSITNTLRYTQLVSWNEENGFHCKAAKSLEEATGLIEAGFDYVTELEGVKLFRKRK